MRKYNGWSNRETWLVNLWFEPHTQSDLDCARDTLEEEYDTLSSHMKDFIDLSIIDWDELADHIKECDD